MQDKINTREFLFWSTASFVIPLLFGIYFRAWLSVVALLGVIVFSYLYHHYQERKFKIIDSVFAWLLIITNLWIIYLGNFTEPYFLAAILFVVPALYCYFIEQKRDFYVGHGFWHIFSAFITLFSILTFIY